MKIEKKLQHAIQSHNPAKIKGVFEQIYYDYGKLVWYVISKYVSNPHDVEELVDDVFVSFSTAMFTVELHNVKAFLATVAKNAAVDFVRRNSGRQITYAEDALPAVATTTCDTPFWEMVGTLQQYLSPQETDIVLQHAVFGYTFSELSAKHNMAPSTVGSVYYRAIKKIKKENLL